MKILYLCPDLGIPVLGRKGAAVHVREVISALSRAGHRVVLAAQTLNKSPWEKPAEFDTPLLQVRPASGTAAAVLALKEFNEMLGTENSLPGELRRILYNRELEAELKRRFENDPPDVVYERCSLYATAGVALARAFGVPYLLELNAPLAQEQAAYRATALGDLAARAERWALVAADAVLVVSAVLREHVLEAGVDPARVHVVPNGVNSTSFQPGPADPNVAARLSLNGGPVLGFVGGLRPWHGLEILPELLERLIQAHPRLRLVVAGDGPIRKQLEDALKTRGLQSRAAITGLIPHDEVAPIIRQFDIALAPYPQSDHAFYFSPLKLFEYMACGIPVVAANVGQISEILRDGENGMLYPPGDVDALTNRCEQLLADASLRRRLGTAAAELVRTNFTWEHNAARIAEIAGNVRAARKS